MLAGVSCVLVSCLVAASISILTPAPGQKLRETEKKTTNRAMRWDPPNVDRPLTFLTPASPCNLSEVLKQAGTRAEEMEKNLSDFTADETIQYEFLGRVGDPVEYKMGTFEYVAVLTPTSWGASVREARTAVKGTQPFSASNWDRGLPGLALIFLPKLQTDYKMKCDGQTEWNDHPSWVIQFHQRARTTSHSWSYVGRFGGVHEAKLKGRAWLSADSGDVVHLETTLLESVPEVHVRNSWFSINYGPVQFHSRNVRLWLPQAVDSYTQFDDMDEHRLIIYHSFTNFMLFTVQTNQQIKKPAEPQ